MKNLSKYYDFIKDEETKNIVRKIADKAFYVKKNCISAVTEFVSPYTAELSVPVINSFNIKNGIFPSYKYSERKVFILYPDFLYDFDEEDASEFIIGMRIKNKSKFKKLSHKDYLGSIMSLGIDRNKTGDIYVYEDYADILIHNDISDYIVYNLDKIGNNKVEVHKLKLRNINFKEPDHVLFNINSSSLRLDNIVKHLINKSRETSSEIIKSGRVKVNWVVENKTSKIIEENDMISISKYGRFKIYKCVGITKNGKNKIEIKHYV